MRVIDLSTLKAFGEENPVFADTKDPGLGLVPARAESRLGIAGGCEGGVSQRQHPSRWVCGLQHHRQQVPADSVDQLCILGGLCAVHPTAQAGPPPDQTASHGLSAHRTDRGRNVWRERGQVGHPTYIAVGTVVCP